MNKNKPYNSCLRPYKNKIFFMWFNERKTRIEIQQYLKSKHNLTVDGSTISRFIKSNNKTDYPKEKPKHLYLQYKNKIEDIKVVTTVNKKAGAYRSCLLPYTQVIFKMWFDDNATGKEIQKFLMESYNLQVSIPTITRFIATRRKSNNERLLPPDAKLIRQAKAVKPQNKLLEIKEEEYLRYDQIDWSEDLSTKNPQEARKILGIRARALSKMTPAEINLWNIECQKAKELKAQQAEKEQKEQQAKQAPDELAKKTKKQSI